MSTKPASSTKCLKCLYDLRGLPDESRCPECGQSVAASRYCDPALLDAQSVMTWTLALGGISVLSLPAMFAGVILFVSLVLIITGYRIEDLFVSVIISIGAWVFPVLMVLAVRLLFAGRFASLVRLSPSMETRCGHDAACRVTFWLMISCWVEFGLCSLCGVDFGDKAQDPVKSAVILMAPLLGGFGVPVLTTFATNRVVKPLMKLAGRDGFRWQVHLAERLELLGLAMLGLWTLLIFIAFQSEIRALWMYELHLLLSLGGLSMVLLGRLSWLRVVFRFRQYLVELGRPVS